MAKQFRVNQLILSGVDITHTFYPQSNPSGYITSGQTGSFVTNSQTGNFLTTSQTGSFVTTSQTGNYVDSASNLGTGSGIFSSKSNATLQFKSLLPGSGILFTGDANTLSINTYFGSRLSAAMSLDTVMTTGSLYYNLVSGTVGAGTWLTVAQSTFRVPGNYPTGIKIAMQLWNGNTGAGIFSSAQSSITTSGQTNSGFLPIDLTAILTLTGTTTMALRAVSTLPNTYALSSATDMATGLLSGNSTYINMVRLL